MRSLSARLLVIPFFFVMLAEVLIFRPHIANYCVSWLDEKLGGRAFGVETMPDSMVSGMLCNQFLSHVPFIVHIR